MPVRAIYVGVGFDPCGSLPAENSQGISENKNKEKKEMHFLFLEVA